MTTNNLTEQWKKGELKQGWYYVLLFSNEEYITFIDGNWVVDDRLIGADIKEVLAPIPSYEQWQSLNELLDSMRDTNKVLAHKLNNIKVNGNYPDRISKLKSRIKGLMEKNEKLEELLKNVTDECDIEKQKALLKINELSGLLKDCRDGLEKIKHIGETKKLGAVYQVAERTLAKIDEVLK